MKFAWFLSAAVGAWTAAAVARDVYFDVDLDVNFIRASDLPKSAARSYSEHGRGYLPDFPSGYGIENALRSRGAEADCMANVGGQLTSWKPQISQVGNYWFYTISAEFECTPPILSTQINGEAARKLFEDMKGIASIAVAGELRKASKILCYENLDEVCTDHALHGYLEHDTCELNGLDGIDSSRIDDVSDEHSVRQSEGARALASDLPIYSDRRRDDVPGPNCGGHVFNQLKGLSRKAATVRCSQATDGSDGSGVFNASTANCQIEGMIQPDHIL